MEYSQHSFLQAAGLEQTNNMTCFDGEKWCSSGEKYNSVNPSTNQTIGESVYASVEDYERCVKNMESVTKAWRSRTMPERGDIVREIGEKLREKRDLLGSIISLEMGKIKAEGDGEVQEVIDLCDFACGLSRSITGKVIPSERPEHSMYEVWNPLGMIGVITAFNFPVAVFGWNLALALVCGNTVHWKGAPTVPLVTIATTKIINEVLAKHNALGVLTCSVGGKDIGEVLVNDKRMPLISFTGSTAVGRIVAGQVANRFGKSILELGGNNATIVMPDANEELVIKGSLFAAVGTCGQRCTSLRRLIIHESLYDSIVSKLVKAYATIPIGSQLSPDTLCGPLHSKGQINTYVEGLDNIKKAGGKVLCGGEVIQLNGGNFVKPTIVEVQPDNSMINTELFVPIMYVMKFKTFDEAIEMNNSVPQGLSSSVFTNSIQTQQQWMGPNGSDCGIVNVNIGPSGAEIGGAFGGEKETGGGRESGSDAWKQYMRRQTCTVNYGSTLPLAQGIKFDL